MSADTLIKVRYVGNSQPGDRTVKIVGSQGEIKLGDTGYLTESELARIGRYQLERLDDDPAPVVADLTSEPEPETVDLTATAPPPVSSFGTTTTPGTGN